MGAIIEGFKKLKWYEWIMFVAMIVIGGYYMVTDVIAVIQWIILADAIMITKKSIYLIMAVIGLYQWRKLQKTRNIENV